MDEKTMVVQYVEARQKCDELSSQLDEVKSVLKRCEQKIVDTLLEKEATSTAKYDGIGSISLTKPKVRASVKKENEDLLFTFLRDQGYDSLIKEAVHHSSLSSFVGGLLEEGESLPEFINYFLYQGVQFRKST